MKIGRFKLSRFRSLYIPCRNKEIFVMRLAFSVNGTAPMKNKFYSFSFENTSFVIMTFVLHSLVQDKYKNWIQENENHHT